jgi:hypothetical protein
MGKYGKVVGEANWGTAYIIKDEKGQIYQPELMAHPRFDNEIFVFDKQST